MTRTLQIVNMLLLVALGSLCLVQWRREHDYAARIENLGRQTSHQGDKIGELEDSLRLGREDIENFRTQVTALHAKNEEADAQIRQARARAFVMENERNGLAQKAESLGHSVEEHRSALAERDEGIRQLLAQRDQLVAANKDAAGKANQAITSYNELGSKYDELVRQYNQLAAQYKAEHEARAVTP